MSNCEIWMTEITGWLQVTGEDAGNYLHSQFSQDLRPLSQGEWTYGLLLNLKGKVRADSFITCLDKDTYCLVSYHTHTSGLQSILEENVIADDVEFEQVQSGGSLVVRGNRPDAAFPNALIFPGRWMNEEHYDVILPSGDTLPDNYKTYQELEEVRIRSGMVAVPADIGQEELPQEGDLDNVALSFNKGCYLGQEVMARIKAMGQVQRKIFQIIGTDPAPASGAEIRYGDKSAGQVRSVCLDKNGNNWHALALLRWRMVEENTEPWTLPDHKSFTFVKSN
jgi:folate-binding protein YgfZ